MLNRRFTPYLTVVGIIAFFSVSYLGYRAYQNHVEFEAFLSETEKFQLALATDPTSAVGSADWQIAQRGGNSTSPTRGLATNQTGRSKTRGGDTLKTPVKVKLLPPEKVAQYSHGDPNGSVVIRNSPSPKIPDGTWTEHDMVTQFIELPDGTIVETRVLRDLEIREGDAVSLKYIVSHMPPENTHAEIGGVRHEIPLGADRDQYLQKLFWAHQLGVSVEEADQMIVKRELIVKKEGESMTSEEEGIMSRLLNKIPKFASFLRSERPDLYEAETVPDGVHQQPPESQGVKPGEFDSSPSPFPSIPSESESRSHRAKGEKQAPVPSEPPTALSQETRLGERLSPERFDKAQQFIEQYGTEEGLRRLREVDPEAARQFERERKTLPARNEPETR